MLDDSRPVMPGLGPGIHAFGRDSIADVDGRAKPGHDPVSVFLPAGTSAWILSDGKIGDEVQCFGIAEALGLAPERRLIKPRGPWRWFAPYAPVASRDIPARVTSPIAAPFPEIVFAAGRQTVPYLRRIRKESRGRTFTVFIKDPYTGPQTADVIWV